MSKSSAKDINDDSNQGKFSIVALGASAGGIQALKEFFSSVKEDSGLCYIVILHLSPDHDSQLAEILQTACNMPVTQVTETTIVKPDHVYVIPPDKHLNMVDGKLKVIDNRNVEDRRAPVDIFFRTLADSHQQRAIAVILSGTGANGSMGLKRIKEKGGVVFVQDPTEALFDDMPRHSIATNLVDEILPVSKMAARILQYKNNFEAGHIEIEKENNIDAHTKALHDVFTLLRVHTGHDFSNYKRPTLLRRIERRINIFNFPDIITYVAYLRQNKDEINALLKDLLISVTNFFRDTNAFNRIKEKVLPEILKGKGAMDEVRIWAAGCATGEEVYSLAIICAELLSDVVGAPRVQLFATDIDEAAIRHAREGLYSLNDIADVSPERTSKYFKEESNGYRIRREIREMILFATHNFIKDPPFSRLDLVVCRNVLIYFNKTAQQHAIQTFHFALKPDGFLFLGSSESAEGSGDYFEKFDRQYHIFRSRKKYNRQPLPITQLTPADMPELNFNTLERKFHRSDLRYHELHQQLLEEYAAPSLVVNEENEIVHLSNKVSRYLEIKGGELSQNLLKLAKPDIRVELRSALYKASHEKKPVEIKAIKVKIDGVDEVINIFVKPVFSDDNSNQGFLLVIFEPGTSESRNEEYVVMNNEVYSKQLEDEIIRFKDQIKASVEQHEFQAEELKASNEELQALNEELRSSAEELETSKEELQSVNEELLTVNQELKVKIEETSIYSNNLQNLINSASIGTIFLDRGLRVVLFTPTATDIFNLIPADTGRMLSDITHKLEYNNIDKDAELVLARLQNIEKEVATTDGRTYIMRLLPYRTNEDQINGIVITFIDISERKQHHDQLQKSVEKYRSLFNAIDEGCLIAEVTHDEATNTIDVLYIDSNVAAEKLTGISYKNRRLREVEPDLEPYWYEQYLHVVKTGESVHDIRRVNSLKAWHDIKVFKTGNFGDNTIAILFQDITESKNAEDLIRLSEERHRVTLQAAEMGAWDLNVADNIVEWNDQHYFLLGLAPTDSKKTVDYFLQFIHPDDVESVSEKFNTAIAAADVFHAEFRIRRADNGSIRWMSGYGRTIEKKDGKASRMVGVLYDITNSKKLEQQKDEFIGIASHELKTPITSIKGYAQLLEQTYQDEGDTKHKIFVSKMGRQVDRLVNLISSLLDTTKISEGQMQLQKETIDLNALTSEIISDMKLMSGLHLFQFIPGELKEVKADKERIAQVISNFISNAIKYSPDSSTITVKTEQLNDSVKLTVSDEGMGIPEDMKDKVFNRFFRVNNPQLHTFPGLGLGLYICAGIVKRHGGTVGVESELNKGSDFYFTLPVE